MKEIEQIEVHGPVEFPGRLTGRTQPLVLKGLVADWPVVAAAEHSHEAVDQYLRGFYNDAPVTISVGSPDIEGRIFYTEGLTGLNFETRRGQLDEVLGEIGRCASEERPPVYYVGSTTVDLVLPGFRDDNDLPFSGPPPSIRIWVGNRTRIAAHYDIPDNIACVAAGRRRFTLFPPDQFRNLYVGPIDLTPAGQSISLVDLRDPDFEKYPKFREALDHALVADMDPGDGIFIPSMWWHHVEGLDTLNVLVNYWWRNEPAYLGTPLDVLRHALLGIRDLPVEQREVWRDIFDHYIFTAGEDVIDKKFESLM